MLSNHLLRSGVHFLVIYNLIEPFSKLSGPQGIAQTHRIPKLLLFISSMCKILTLTSFIEKIQKLYKQHEV